MKKLIPLLLAGLVFVLALVLMRPEATTPVLVTARTLPAGHILAPSDLELRAYPQSLAPQGALSDPLAAAGQPLAVARQPGDPLYPALLGGERLHLAVDERAVAIQVSDSSGLAGLLQPGDRVGLTAVIFGASGQGAFAKALPGGYRVLYLSPEFQALDPAPVEESDSGGFSRPASSGQRQDQGVVVLAVPVQAQILAYDFAAFGVESAARQISLVDLLPALDHAQNVELSLFLEPDDAGRFLTSGVYLPDLVITPGPSPTPTATPPNGMAPAATAVP